MIPASILLASIGATGRIANSSPAANTALHRSSPREGSSRLISNPCTAVQPVRLISTGMSPTSNQSHQ